MFSGSVINHYKGFAGGVRSLQYRNGRDSHSLVAGCGLDRFLRVFQMEPPKLLHQVGCCSLNCLTDDVVVVLLTFLSVSVDVLEASVQLSALG